MRINKIIPLVLIIAGFFATLVVFYVRKEENFVRTKNRILFEFEKPLNYSECMLNFDGNVVLHEFSSNYSNKSDLFNTRICMSNEQIRVFQETSDLRPKLSTNYSGYLGPWIEDGVFCNWLLQYNSNLVYCNEESIPPVYIPIFWTSLQRNKVDIEQKNEWIKKTQLFLDTLNPDLIYFTVLQDAEGVKKLNLNFNSKNNIVVFNAGGATTGFKQVPIPLIKGELQKEDIIDTKKDIWISSSIIKKRFPVRKKLFEKLEYRNITDSELTRGFSNGNIRGVNSESLIESNNKDFVFYHYEGERFKEVIKRSVFHLCPRGFGRTSFRLYETIQLGTIPIYLWEDLGWYPYGNLLGELGIVLESSEIDNIPLILSAIGEKEIKRKLDISHKSSYWFTYQGITEYIIKVVKLIKEDAISWEESELIDKIVQQVNKQIYQE